MEYLDGFEENDENIFILENPDMSNYFFESQAADILKVDRSTFRKMIEAGKVEARKYKVADRVRYRIWYSNFPARDYFFTVKEAAKVLGCHASTVGRRVESGDLEAWFFNYDGVYTWVYKDSVFAFDKSLGERKRSGRRRFPRRY